MFRFERITSMDKQTLKTAITKLTRELTDAGVNLPKNKILEMVAKSFGYQNYNTLLGCLNENNVNYFENKEYEKISRILVFKILPNKRIYFDANLKRTVEDDIVDLWENCRKKHNFDKTNIMTKIDKDNHLIIIDFSKHKQDYSKPVIGNNNGWMFFLMSFSEELKNNSEFLDCIEDIRFIETTNKHCNTSFLNAFKMTMLDIPSRNSY